MGWLDEVREVPIKDVVGRLQLGLCDRGRRLERCPECDAETRSNSDRRPGPVTLYADYRWHCHSCGADDDAVGLVRRVVGPDWGQVRNWYAGQGYCAGDGREHQAPRREPRPAPKPAEPKYPPNLRAVLSRSPVVGKGMPDFPAWKPEWLKLDHSLIPARVLPPGFRQDWWPYTDQWRVVVPLYNVAGDLCSMQARAHCPSVTPKTRTPKGCDVRGLFFADPWLALPMLRGEASPEVVLVTEGLSSFLYVAAKFRQENLAGRKWTTGEGSGVAVLGWISGTDLTHARLTGNVVAVFDPDTHGMGYTHKLAEQLAAKRPQMLLKQMRL